MTMEIMQYHGIFCTFNNIKYNFLYERYQKGIPNFYDTTGIIPVYCSSYELSVFRSSLYCCCCYIEIVTTRNLYTLGPLQC